MGGGFRQQPGQFQQQPGQFQQQQPGQFQQQQPGQFQQFQQQQPGQFQQQGGFPPQQNVDRQRRPPAPAPAAAPQQPKEQLPPRSKVFFDIEVEDGQGRERYGRITMELFDEVVPRTTRNFLEIAAG